jgi:4a-hydroxytetrahydrobiopterin dehydratase
MWHEENNTLSREFTFPDFKSALTFVNTVGELAETANHHPDISLGWGKVTVTLTTHDAGGVTDKDRRLAEEIDKAL